MKKTVVIGHGVCFPKNRVTNFELSETLDTTNEWIYTRTGILSRHLASKDDSVASLGAQACLAALAKAKIHSSEIDAIILATTTPDDFLPATAVKIQDIIQAKNAFAFDVQAVCSGFLYALSIADSFIKNNMAKNILVVGAEIMSKMLDWNDRGTCILFGDGAGAILVTAKEYDGDGGCDDNHGEGCDGKCNKRYDEIKGRRGIISSNLFSDGSFYNMLCSDNNVETQFHRGAIKMNGRVVFVEATDKMTEAIKKNLSDNNLSVNDISWLVAHQANKRIIENVAKRLEMPIEKALLTIEEYANTSAATIPTTLSIAADENKIKEGDLVMLCAMGSGFAWGAMSIVW